MRFIGICCLIAFMGNGWSQQCDPGRPMSTPAERFFDNGDGTVTELASGLTWMRCALGQAWRGERCRGRALALDRHAARRHINSLNATVPEGQPRWRLPRLSELATIVERQCRHPRINQRVFPDTVSGSFWSADARAGDTDRAYAMSFGAHGVQSVPLGSALYTRPVQGRD